MMRSSTLAGLALILPAWGPSILQAQYVTFRLDNITAGPGNADLSVPLFVDVAPAPAGVPVEAIWVTVKYDPRVLGHVLLESTRETVHFEFREQALFLDSGMVGMTALFSTSLEPHDERMIAPGGTAQVANLRFCILDAA